jgi:hypothetical protein
MFKEKPRTKQNTATIFKILAQDTPGDEPSKAHLYEHLTFGPIYLQCKKREKKISWIITDWIYLQKGH